MAKSSATFSYPAIIHALIAVSFIALMAVLFRICQVYVDRSEAKPTRPPHVALMSRPAWMSDALADHFLREIQPMGLHSAFDHKLLVDTAAILQKDPWVQQVRQIRREYDLAPGDTLLVDCQFRTPMALVKWGTNYWLVDNEGVKLPEKYSHEQLPSVLFSRDGRINVRIIDGVDHEPPAVGQQWKGDDLKAALDLARLLAGRNWAEQATQIDVSNFNGRMDSDSAQLVLITRFGTQVRWGRPPNAADAFIEAPAAQKLAELESLYRNSHRIDANYPWIDLRFDRVTGPQPAAEEASTTPKASD